MNKFLQLKCCINIKQDNTYGILLISYVKVNDGNIMMLLLVASQTLPVCFVHEKKINFSIIANLVCNLVGVANLVWTHNGVLFVTWPAAAEHLEEIWTEQGKYWIQTVKTFFTTYIYLESLWITEFYRH